MHAAIGGDADIVRMVINKITEVEGGGETEVQVPCQQQNLT